MKNTIYNKTIYKDTVIKVINTPAVYNELLFYIAKLVTCHEYLSHIYIYITYIHLQQNKC